MRATEYEFDGFRLDVQQRVLLALPQAAPVELQPRVFDALLYFVERAGELLGKRELLQALWPSVVVEENSLNQVVSQLRKALGEKPSEHRYIVTSPGRGYRFVAAVRALSGGRATAQSEPHPLSLAVLPFTNRMTGSDRLALGEAIAADLSHLLSARSRLRVTAHTSSAEAWSQQPDARLAGALLNVSRVVTGEVAGDARQLVVKVRLLDAATGSTLWLHGLHGSLGGVAELQGELARHLAQIIDPEGTQPPVTPATVAPAAYLDYLKALSLSQRPSPPALPNPSNCCAGPSRSRRCSHAPIRCSPSSTR